MRLFVAVDLDPAVNQRVAELIALHAPRAPKARWVKPEKLHVTLVFLGNVEDALVPQVEAAVQAGAQAHAPLTLHARGAGGFPSKTRPRVLWLGLEGDLAPLAALQATLSQHLVPLGYEPEHREYRPHLTLARAPERSGEQQLARCIAALGEVDLGASEVREVVLYQSKLSPKGATYTALVRAPLCA